MTSNRGSCKVTRVLWHRLCDGVIRCEVLPASYWPRRNDATMNDMKVGTLPNGYGSCYPRVRFK